MSILTDLMQCKPLCQCLKQFSYWRSLCAFPGQQGEEATSLSSLLWETLVSRDLTIVSGVVWIQDITESHIRMLHKHHGLIWPPRVHLGDALKFSYPRHWDIPLLLCQGLPKAHKKGHFGHWWPSGMEYSSIFTWYLPGICRLSINFCLSFQNDPLA